MFKLSLRDLRAHLGRYALTFLAIAIGVAFVGGVTLTDTLSRSFDDLISTVNAGTDIWMRGESQFTASAQFGGGEQRPRIDALVLPPFRGPGDGTGLTRGSQVGCNERCNALLNGRRERGSVTPR